MAAFLVLSACNEPSHAAQGGSSGTQASSPEVGRLAMSLTTDVDGTTYRLRDALFDIMGPRTIVISSGTDSNAEVVHLVLPVGSYRVELNDGWALGRADSSGSTRVDARLVSPNPFMVDITANSVVRIALRFAIRETMVAGTGSVQFGVDVQVINPAPAWQSPLRLDPNDNPDLRFASLALSADARWVVFGAPVESSAARGVDSTDPGPGDSSAEGAGAAYVLDISDPLTPKRTYLKAFNTDAQDAFGTVVAISANGDTLAVGAPGEQGGGTGVNNTDPGPADNSMPGAGAVYVFERSGTSWTQTAYLKNASQRQYWGFGSYLALSGDGNTLAVLGCPANNGSAICTFIRGADGWSAGPAVVSANPATEQSFGASLALSEDGSTLAAGAYSDKSTARGIYPAFVAGGFSRGFFGAASVFTRVNGVWSLEAYIKASNADYDDHFGRQVVLSADGNSLAVGTALEDSAATGVNDTRVGQDDNSLDRAGAVYIFNRLEHTWTQTAYLKAPDATRVGSLGIGFGSCVAISSDGTVLAVAAGGAVVPEIYGLKFQNNRWLESTSPLVSSDTSYPINSVALSADGNVLLAGGASYGGGALLFHALP